MAGSGWPRIDEPRTHGPPRWLPRRSTHANHHDGTVPFARLSRAIKAIVFFRDKYSEVIVNAGRTAVVSWADESDAKRGLGLALLRELSGRYGVRREVHSGGVSPTAAPRYRLALLKFNQNRIHPKRIRERVHEVG